MPLPVAKLFAMRATEPFTLTLSQGTVPETKDPAPLNAEKCTFCNTNIPNVRAAHFSLGSIPDWVQSAPANQLERFTMDLVPSPSSTSHPPIIEKLFDDKTPKLRELFLSGFRLGWHAKAYHNLKKLSISLEQIPDSTSRTLIGEGRDIVLILQNSPHLEELSLKHPPIMQDVSLSSTPLDLPHLSRLNLDLVTSDVCFLLSAIISPPHQRLCIRAYELIGAFGLRQGPFSILPPDPRCSQCIGSLSHLEINVHRQMVRGWTTTSNNEKPSVEIMFSSFEDMMMTLLTIRTMDLASNLEVVHLVGSTLNLTGSDVVQALKLSSRITTLRLEGCSSSILNLLAIQVLHSRVPVASNLHTFNFCQMKVESKDILSLSNSFATRIRKVVFDACTFESQEIERQLLADLRQSGAVDVLSSNAVIMKRYVHHDPVQSPANPDKPAKQTHRAVSRGGSRSSANAAAPTAESGRSKKGKKKKKK